MESVQPQDPLFMSAARKVYRTVRGGYRLVCSFRNSLLNQVDAPVVVLVYHRVSDLSSDPELIAVSPENFRSQMAYLKERYPILRFEEDWSGVQRPAVAITFDDGYADNLQQALPILKEFEVPATFFVSTGMIGTTENFWWHRLEALMLRETERPASFRLDDPRYNRCWDTATPDQRQLAYAALSVLMRKIDAERREAWFDQLLAWAGTVEQPDSFHRLMSDTEIQSLAASPLATLGAHTVTHSALSTLSPECQREEIFNSKKALEALTGKPVTTFSYPFGRKQDYNRTSVRLCREACFQKVAANFPGQYHRWTDPLQIPRHLVRNWEVKRFAAELHGFWTR